MNKGHHPFESWAIDYITNLLATAKGYYYLLFMVDILSNWVDLVPMSSKESSEVAEAIQLHIIA